MDYTASDIARRLNALADFDILDTPPEPEFDHVAMRAAELCRMPMATVTLLDGTRQWFKAEVGVGVRETPLDHAFCAHTISRPDEVMVVTNACADDRFRDNPYVTGSPRIRFYAGAPLVTATGVPIGTVCVMDRRPRHFSIAERATLAAFARETVAHLEARRWRRLAQTEQERGNLLGISEAYFRHLTEHALDLCTILDESGVILFESRSIERELGYDPAHYRGRNAFEFVHPEDRDTVVNAFRDARERHGSTPLIRFRFLHGDGSYRILEGSGNNLLDDPAVRGIVFNSRNVTERVRLQEEVERARFDKEEAIARLTGGVAHDFNNILTAVQGLSELTRARVPIGSPENGYLSEILEATTRAAKLTQQLLAFSRRTVLQPCALELGRWLDGLKPRLQGVLGNAIKLTVVSSRDLRVWEDPTLFEQVILQLADNAREAMPAGGHFTIDAGPIFLGPHERPDDGHNGDAKYIQITLADQGSGMAEATVARIFEPFFTTKTGGNHPGLGLCMCRGIVEQSGGHLTVHSYPGRGTVFHIFLPAFDAAESIDIPIPPSPAVSGGIPTILFVDDEPMLREIGETILLEAGYRVVVAADGAEALTRLAELGTTPLDLLVTDVVMPGINGVQLAEEVTRLRPGTRVLLCSGYTRDALNACGGVPPGVAFLAKPYSLSVLLEKVSEMLQPTAV